MFRSSDGRFEGKPKILSAQCLYTLEKSTIKLFAWFAENFVTLQLSLSRSFLIEMTRIF